MYDIIELNVKVVAELKQIAKELNIPKHDKLVKQELIYKILDFQALNPSVQTLEEEKKIKKRPKIIKRKPINKPLPVDKPIADDKPKADNKPLPIDKPMPRKPMPVRKPMSVRKPIPVNKEKDDNIDKKQNTKTQLSLNINKNQENNTPIPPKDISKSEDKIQTNSDKNINPQNNKENKLQ